MKRIWLVRVNIAKKSECVAFDEEIEAERYANVRRKMQPGEAYVVVEEISLLLTKNV